MVALPRGAEEAHRDALTVGASLAAAAATVSSSDDGRAFSAFRSIVPESKAGWIQKREQVLAFAVRAFDRTMRLLVGVEKGEPWG